MHTDSEQKQNFLNKMCLLIADDPDDNKVNLLAKLQFLHLGPNPSPDYMMSLKFEQPHSLSVWLLCPIKTHNIALYIKLERITSILTYRRTERQSDDPIT